MFGLSGTEIAVILLIALIVFGPKQLPKLAHRLGRTLRELRQASQELKSGLESDLMRDDSAPSDVSRDVRSATPATGAKAARAEPPSAEVASPPREANAQPDTRDDGRGQIAATAVSTDASKASPAGETALPTLSTATTAEATSKATPPSAPDADAAIETVHLAESTGDVPQAARDLRRPDAGI